MGSTCAFIFLDHREDKYINEKLQFYRSVFPKDPFYLIVNTARIPVLARELIDNVTIITVYQDKLYQGGYLAAALYMMPTIPRSIIDYQIRVPSIIVESDLEVCRRNIKDRVHDLVSGGRIGMCCFKAKPPKDHEFHNNDFRIMHMHKAAFDTDQPIAATTLGGSVMTYAGAKAICELYEQPRVQAYYQYLLEMAHNYESGRVWEIPYAAQYFTDYFFPSACKLAGLSLADSINHIIPRYNYQAGETVDVDSYDEVLDALNDERMYVIHHLSRNYERFPGAFTGLDLVREAMLNE